MRLLDFFRPRKHAVFVAYVYQDLTGKKAFPPYYTALCECGWTADVVEATYPDQAAEETVIAQALGHDPQAQTAIDFLLERPPSADTDRS